MRNNLITNTYFQKERSLRGILCQIVDFGSNAAHTDHRNIGDLSATSIFREPKPSQCASKRDAMAIKRKVRVRETRRIKLPICCMSIYAIDRSIYAFLCKN